MSAQTAKHPLVLVPGLLCDQNLYQPQIDYFSSTCQVLIGDVKRSDSIQGMAADVLDQCPEKFSLAGLSLGGIVAMEILRQAPDRVERVALLDTSPGAEHPKYKPTRLHLMEQIRVGGLPALLSLVNESFFPNYVAAAHLHDKSIKSRVVEMTKSAGADTFLRQSQALLERPDSWPTLEEIRCPALVMCGEEDVMCTPTVHREMAKKIAGAQLVIIKDCGHLCTLEKPDEVNRALDAWLKASL